MSNTEFTNHFGQQVQFGDPVLFVTLSTGRLQVRQGTFVGCTSSGRVQVRHTTMRFSMKDFRRHPTSTITTLYDNRVYPFV